MADFGTATTSPTLDTLAAAYVDSLRFAAYNTSTPWRLETLGPPAAETKPGLQRGRSGNHSTFDNSVAILWLVHLQLSAAGCFPGNRMESKAESKDEKAVVLGAEDLNKGAKSLRHTGTPQVCSIRKKLLDVPIMATDRRWAT